MNDFELKVYRFTDKKMATWAMEIFHEEEETLNLPQTTFLPLKDDKRSIFIDVRHIEPYMIEHVHYHFEVVISEKFDKNDFKIVGF